MRRRKLGNSIYFYLFLKIKLEKVFCCKTLNLSLVSGFNFNMGVKGKMGSALRFELLVLALILYGVVLM